jgi:hypothetical protein
VELAQKLKLFAKTKTRTLKNILEHRFKFLGGQVDFLLKNWQLD